MFGPGLFPRYLPAAKLYKSRRKKMADDLSLDAAEKVVAAAKKKAAEINTKMDIAVVDAGCNLKAFARMDGAWLGSIDISIRKARTSRYFDMPTGAIGQLSQPG